MQRHVAQLLIRHSRRGLTLALGALGIGVGWVGPGRVVAEVGSQLRAARASALAGRAQDRCGRLSRDEKIRCYDDALLPLAREGQVRFAMATLEHVAAADPDAAFQAHGYAHAIGMAAVGAGRDPRQSLRGCTAQFDAGCYHGVIQVHLERSPQLAAADLDALCDSFVRAVDDVWHRFQCAHGIGHGLTMHFRYDLPRALEGCDRFGNLRDQEACYSGALMENTASFVHANGSPMLHVDHGSAGSAQSTGHEGHSPAVATPSFRRADPNDPYYPCSVLAARYLTVCYHAQPALTLALNNLDYAGTARMCDGAPAAMRISCYHGLGNQIRPQAGGDNALAVRLCALGSSALQPWCYDGVVKSLVNFTGRPADGFVFCGLVPVGPNRTQCFAALGYEMLFLGGVDREALCDRARAEDRVACRFGARLSATGPAGLPRDDGATAFVK
jgi:hypothetical protein